MQIKMVFACIIQLYNTVVLYSVLLISKVIIQVQFFQLTEKFPIWESKPGSLIIFSMLYRLSSLGWTTSGHISLRKTYLIYGIFVYYGIFGYMAIFDIWLIWSAMYIDATFYIQSYWFLKQSYPMLPIRFSQQNMPAGCQSRDIKR